MPHGFGGLGWGEVASLVTLIIVIANFFKSSVSHTAHESTRKDMSDLNDKLADLKININELIINLRQFNKDFSKLAKRVDKHDSDIAQLRSGFIELKTKWEEEHHHHGEH